MSGNAREAHFVAILGVTGCGKSHELKKRLKARRRSRTIIWSPKERKDQYAAFYPGSKVVRSASDAVAVLQAAGRGGFHLVFVPTLERRADEAMFSVLCKAALAAEDLTLVVEELHSVTKPAHAPHGWALVNFMGRGLGVEVFGLSQRPASVDKDFMGSLSELWVGELTHPPDQDAVAKIIRIDAAEVAGLAGHDALHFDFRKKKLTRKPAKKQ